MALTQPKYEWIFECIYSLTHQAMFLPPAGITYLYANNVIAIYAQPMQHYPGRRQIYNCVIWLE